MQTITRGSTTRSRSEMEMSIPSNLSDIDIRDCRRPGKHKWIKKSIRTSSTYLLAATLYILAHLLLPINNQSVRLVDATLDLPDLTRPKADNDTPEPCESCTVLVKSFEKGMDKTTRGKHEGGDTSWEERNLKSYADSEIRLVEIQEDLCDDVTTGKAQCYSMAEDAEQHIEEWWFKHRNKNVRLHDYLCITKLKKCCPADQFGATCQKCTDCRGHGRCDGSGTRAGSGECMCHLGYVGKQCEECAEDYYSTRTSDGESTDGFECLECHQACKGGCLGPTSANCTECRPGYARDSQTKLCIDINECESATGPGDLQLDSSKLCPDGTYCVNTDGHYRCSKCHWSCETCLGYGPDKCFTCAAEYEMDDKHECQHFSVQAKTGSNLNYWSLVLMLVAPTYVLYSMGRRLASAFCRVVGIDEVESVYTQIVLKVFVSIIVTALAYCVDHKFLTYHIRTLHKTISSFWSGQVADSDDMAPLDSDEL